MEKRDKKIFHVERFPRQVKVCFDGPWFPPTPFHVKMFLAGWPMRRVPATLTWRGGRGDGQSVRGKRWFCVSSPGRVFNGPLMVECGLLLGLLIFAHFLKVRGSSGHARAPTSPRKPCDIAPLNQTRSRRFLAQI